MAETVSEKDLKACLVQLRNLRLWSVIRQVDPWAFRQMLLIALEMDTKAAIDRGISSINLQNFDAFVKKDIKSWMANQP